MATQDEQAQPSASGRVRVMPTFTPGPWTATLLNAGINEDGDCRLVEHWRIGNEEAENSIVAEVTDYAETEEERDANAHLIAAAPDLLEALECLYAEQNGAPLARREEQWNEAMEKAEAAFLKALGPEK